MKNELVDVLESVAYMICKDDDITSDIFYEVTQHRSESEFIDIGVVQIWSYRGVLSKLLACIDKNQDAIYTIEEFMSFLISITSKMYDIIGDPPL